MRPRKEHGHKLRQEGFSPNAPMHHLFRCIGKQCPYTTILPCARRFVSEERCTMCKGET